MYSGFTYEETIAEKAGYCRGWIQDVTNIETNIAEGIYYFYVSVEDAWGPHIQPFRASIDRLYPKNGIKLAWIANECGCQIYQKFDDNGLFFSDEEYCMDCYVPDNSVYEKYPEFREGCEDYTAAQLMEIFALTDMEAVIKRAEEIAERKLAFSSFKDSKGVMHTDQPLYKDFKFQQFRAIKIVKQDKINSIIGKKVVILYRDEQTVSYDNLWKNIMVSFVLFLLSVSILIYMKKYKN